MLLCIVVSILMLAFLFVLILGYALMSEVQMFLDQNY